MTKFYIMAETRIQVRKILHFKGDIKKHTFDFSSWVDDNGTVTSVTWTVESGQVSITSEALASNVNTLVLTTTEPGTSMLKGIATDGTHSETVYVRIKIKDPQALLVIPDYELCRH